VRASANLSRQFAGRTGASSRVPSKLPEYGQLHAPGCRFSLHDIGKRAHLRDWLARIGLVNGAAQGRNKSRGIACGANHETFGSVPRGHIIGLLPVGIKAV
jgi:hypothetical protein